MCLRQTNGFIFKVHSIVITIFFFWPACRSVCQYVLYQSLCLSRNLCLLCRRGCSDGPPFFLQDALMLSGEKSTWCLLQEALPRLEGLKDKSGILFFRRSIIALKKPKYRGHRCCPLALMMPFIFPAQTLAHFYLKLG